MFALDTNTLIHFFKGAGRVREHLAQVTPDQVAIPAIVVFELEKGIRASDPPSRRRKALGDLLAVCPVLPFDAPAARAAAEISAELDGRGKPIGPMDLLIAATAVSAGAILVTRNTREFSRVPILRVVNWYD